jgi:hypothetical protein
MLTYTHAHTIHSLSLSLSLTHTHTHTHTHPVLIHCGSVGPHNVLVHPPGSPQHATARHSFLHEGACVCVCVCRCVHLHAQTCPHTHSVIRTQTYTHTVVVDSRGAHGRASEHAPLLHRHVLRVHVVVVVVDGAVTIAVAHDHVAIGSHLGSG